MILGCGHGQVEAAVGGVPHASPTAVAIIKDGQLCCSGTILSPISVLTDGKKVCWMGEGLSVVAGVTSFDIVEGKGLFLDWITQYRVEGRFKNIQMGGGEGVSNNFQDLWGGGRKGKYQIV